MVVNITVSLPEELVQAIDKQRGLVNRSRYVTALLESAIDFFERKKMVELKA